MSVENQLAGKLPYGPEMDKNWIIHGAPYY